MSKLQNLGWSRKHLTSNRHIYGIYLFRKYFIGWWISYTLKHGKLWFLFTEKVRHSLITLWMRIQWARRNWPCGTQSTWRTWTFNLKAKITMGFQAYPSDAHLVPEKSIHEFVVKVCCINNLIGSLEGFSTLIWLLFLLQHLYLSSLWLGVSPRMDTKKPCVGKRLDYVLEMW